jgi:hypothetical protein
MTIDHTAGAAAVDGQASGEGANTIAAHVALAVPTVYSGAPTAASSFRLNVRFQALGVS